MQTTKKLLFFLIFLGIVLSVYLTIAHYYTSLPLYCPEGALINCAQVTSSQFSTVASIPIAVGGLIWFIIIELFALSLPKYDLARNVWIELGLGGVVYSILAQMMLGQICVYCISLDLLILICSCLLYNAAKR